jgi:hypothetical protein
VLVHVGGFNLGLFMRTRFGIGTPRSLQGRWAALVAVIAALMGHSSIAPATSASDRSCARLISGLIIASSCCPSASWKPL